MSIKDQGQSFLVHQQCFRWAFRKATSRLIDEVNKKQKQFEIIWQFISYMFWLFLIFTVFINMTHNIIVKILSMMEFKLLFSGVQSNHSSSCTTITTLHFFNIENTKQWDIDHTWIENIQFFCRVWFEFANLIKAFVRYTYILMESLFKMMIGKGWARDICRYWEVR